MLLSRTASDVLSEDPRSPKPNVRSGYHFRDSGVPRDRFRGLHNHPLGTAVREPWPSEACVKMEVSG